MGVGRSFDPWIGSLTLSTTPPAAPYCFMTSRVLGMDLWVYSKQGKSLSAEYVRMTTLQLFCEICNISMQKVPNVQCDNVSFPSYSVIPKIDQK